MSAVASDQGPADANVTLDRVMLAMDVVDTLRHQQALVDAELDDDRREAEFVARVQAIYRSQGIDVDEAVVQEGVRALREDRFTHKPPIRTLQVRLAEVYVERGKWARRTALATLIVAVVWAAIVVPGRIHRQGLIDTFAQRVERLAATAETRAREATELQADWDRAHNEEDSAAIARLLVDAADALARGRDRAAEVAQALAPRPDAATYPDGRTAWDERLAAFAGKLDGATADLGAARGLLGAVRQLRSLSARVQVALQRLAGIEPSARERAQLDTLQRDVRAALDGGDARAAAAALGRLDQFVDDLLAARQRHADIRAQFAATATALAGVDVEPAAAAELAALRTTAEQAMAADDWERAGQQVARLRALVALLDQSYELRIVSRPGDTSGVWRYDVDDRRRRNHYVIVEAIGPDGRALSLPVTSEEDQTTRTVRRFGIRVAESVFERVKADKLDNGIIDDAVFGKKRRGARDPEYRFPVAGGRITEW